MPSLAGCETDYDFVYLYFPSFQRALDEVGGDHYEAGFLIGCLQDVVVCIITAMTKKHPHAPTCQPLNPKQALALRYLREPNQEDPPDREDVLKRIKIDELIDVVREIYEEYEIKYMSSSLDVHHYYRIIDHVEQKFWDVMREAMIEGWFGEDRNDDGIGEMNVGWDDGREQFQEVLAPWLFGPETPRELLPRSIQSQPDRTATKHAPAGSPVPSHLYSRPYTGTEPPQGKCSICLEALANTPVAGLAIARCKAGHIFHAGCLNSWVNGSMDNANKCPHDREQMCKKRAKAYPGLTLFEFDSDLGNRASDTEESDSDDSDSDDSDEEMLDTDADASDDEDLDMDDDALDEEDSDTMSSSSTEDQDIGAEKSNDEEHICEECDMPASECGYSVVKGEHICRKCGIPESECNYCELGPESEDESEVPA